MISSSAEGRYGIDIDGVLPVLPSSTVISPLLRLGVDVVFIDGFSESGAGSLNLSAPEDDFTTATVGLGFAISGDYEIGSYRIQPTATVAYEHLIDQAGATSDLRLQDSQTGFKTNSGLIGMLIGLDAAGPFRVQRTR